MTEALVARDEAQVAERLPELATQARSEYEKAEKSLSRALRHSIAAGEVLLEARKAFGAGRGARFGEWVEKDVGMPYNTANYCMRLARYQEILPEGINLTEAKQYVRGLPAAGTGEAPINAYPEAVRAEARRLWKQGAGFTEIAGKLDVSIPSVHRWCKGRNRNTVADLAKRRRALERIEARERRRREAEKAAKARGGSTAKAYSHLRKLAQELDRSLVKEKDQVVRAKLKAALSDVYRAEVQLSAALGVQHGSWEELA